MTAAFNPQLTAINVSWTSTGGVGPYSGFITATNSGGFSGSTYTYATQPVSGASGTWTDANPQCTGTDTYVLTLNDSSGQTAGKSVQINAAGCG